MYRRLLCVLMFSLFVLNANAQMQSLIKVYVQPGDGEFIENGTVDSSKDLINSLKGKSGTLEVVDNAQDADIVIRIDSRNTRRETTGSSTYVSESKNGKNATASTRTDERTYNILHATLIVGDYQLPLTNESSFSWRMTAGELASSVEHWAKENSAKLLARRAEPQTTAKPVEAQSAQVSNPSAEDGTITPGMTADQVLKVMGTPEKKIIFGSKSMWNYRGMQVVFDSAKVTEVKF